MSRDLCITGRRESRKDKQGEERRERTKESWGLYQASNKEEKKGDKLRPWSKEK